MDNLPLISIIVPVYNVERYLDRCVKSIVDQTYRNLEIILIDDGSPDNCGAICDAWAEKDSRIKVIHKQNGGVSSARNQGIASANGEFVCFVDSDDCVDSWYVELLYRAAEQHQADIAVCKMLLFYGESADLPSYCGTPTTRVNNTRDVMKSLICGGDYKGGPCDKLYRRPLLHSIEFPLDCRHEDEFFAHRIALRAERFVFVDAPLYYYYQRESSFMHSFSLQRLDALAASLERLMLIRERYPDLYHAGKAAFCVACVANCRMALDAPKQVSDQFVAGIRMYRRKLSFGLQEIFTYPVKSVLYIVASELFLVPFSKLLNLRKRVV